MPELVCPRDSASLSPDGEELVCALGHRYPVVQGIPILLVPNSEQTHWFGQRSIDIGSGNAEKWPVFLPWRPSPRQKVHPYVQQIIAKTNGLAYRHLVGKLNEYPIPELPLVPGSGEFLDIGCSWGRWSVAACRKGYTVTGIDPDIYAVTAARDIARGLGIEAQFVVADARYLPFRERVFDVCFSFSVLQHLAPGDVCEAIIQIRRVLRIGGLSMIQMAHKGGLRARYHLARRGQSTGSGFQVRYWSRQDLQTAFEVIGSTEISVQGFLGLGLQKSDKKMMRMAHKLAIHASEGLRNMCGTLPFLAEAADSLMVRSVRDDDKIEKRAAVAEIPDKCS